MKASNICITVASTLALLFTSLSPLAVELKSIEVNQEVVIFSTTRDNTSPISCEIQSEHKNWAFSLASYSGKAMYEMLLKIVDGSSRQIAVTGSGDCNLMEGVEQALSISAPVVALNAPTDDTPSSTNSRSVGLYTGDGSQRLGTVMGTDANAIFYADHNDARVVKTYNYLNSVDYSFSLLSSNIFFQSRDCQGEVYLSGLPSNRRITAHPNYRIGKIMAYSSKTTRQYNSYMNPSANSQCVNTSSSRSSSLYRTTDSEHPLCGGHLCIVKED